MARRRSRRSSRRSYVSRPRNPYQKVCNAYSLSPGAALFQVPLVDAIPQPGRRHVGNFSVNVSASLYDQANGVYSPDVVGWFWSIQFVPEGAQPQPPIINIGPNANVAEFANENWVLGSGIATSATVSRIRVPRYHNLHNGDTIVLMIQQLEAFNPGPFTPQFYLEITYYLST
jgi:hypothetical protein